MSISSIRRTWLEDITRGLMDNAAKCLSNGSLPLGYKPGDDRHVVLDEAEAAIVQEIFTRVSCYEPFIDIARDLNRRGEIFFAPYFLINLLFGQNFPLMFCNSIGADQIPLAEVQKCHLPS